MNDLDQLRAETNAAQNAYNAVSSGSSHAAGAASQPWNPWLISFLTVIVIAFAVLVLHYSRNMLKDGHQPGDILRLTTMPMVITAALFLVMLGYSNNQMTPVIGLLGTLVGYVLGASAPKSARPPAKPEQP